MKAQRKLHFNDGEEVWTYKVFDAGVRIVDPNGKVSRVSHDLIDPSVEESYQEQAEWLLEHPCDYFDDDGPQYSITPRNVKDYIEWVLRPDFLNTPKKGDRKERTKRR